MLVYILRGLARIWPLFFDGPKMESRKIARGNLLDRELALLSSFYCGKLLPGTRCQFLGTGHFQLHHATHDPIVSLLLVTPDRSLRNSDHYPCPGNAPTGAN